MELASRQHRTSVDRNPIFSIIRNALKFNLREPKFSKLLWRHATRSSSCDMLCMQVLLEQYWNKLCIL